jgi:hypothetical protein
VSIDPTITLGNVLTIIALLGGILAFAIRISARLVRIETKVDILFTRYQQECRYPGAD